MRLTVRGNRIEHKHDSIIVISLLTEYARSELFTEDFISTIIANDGFWSPLAFVLRMKSLQKHFL